MSGRQPPITRHSHQHKRHRIREPLPSIHGSSRQAVISLITSRRCLAPTMPHPVWSKKSQARQHESQCLHDTITKKEWGEGACLDAAQPLYYARPACVSGQLTGTAAVRLEATRPFARKSTIGTAPGHLLPWPGCSHQYGLDGMLDKRGSLPRPLDVGQNMSRRSQMVCLPK